MERSELVKKVAIALQDCKTANSISLSEHFTNGEIADFANTVVHYLPISYNKQIEEIDRDIMEIFADKESFVGISLVNYCKQVYIKALKLDEDIEVELTHIILLSLITLKTVFERDIDKSLNDIVNYYKSLLIPSDDLSKNVHAIPARGAVAEFDNQGNYLRVNYETIEFVPTLTTKQNFNYLIPKQWK